MNSLQSELTISHSKMRQLVQEFELQIVQGLEYHDQNISNFPSFITKFEFKNGKYLTVDLGGTNLRISLITIGSGNSIQKKHTLPQKVKDSGGNEIFRFVAIAVSEFAVEHSLTNLKLGFTFSYPVRQEAIDRGSIHSWSKDINGQEVIGKDPVQLLQEQLDNLEANFSVVALVNDTVGTLLAGMHRNNQTKLGVILGTGSNAAYIEKTENIKKTKLTDKSDEMAINTEWGGFDNDKLHLPLTKYDQQVDLFSVNFKAQIFEKMISGLYLGEIMRYIIIDLHLKDELFYSLGMLVNPYSLSTIFMARIQNDKDGSDTLRILNELQVECRPKDYLKLKTICELLSERSAKLAAVGVAAIVNHIKTQNVVVAVDGSLFEHYPGYASLMQLTVNQLTSANVQLELVHDGSSVGAALAASTC